jgi:hypothetical protein
MIEMNGLRSFAPAAGRSVYIRLSLDFYSVGYKRGPDIYSSKLR